MGEPVRYYFLPVSLFLTPQLIVMPFEKPCSEHKVKHLSTTLYHTPKHGHFEGYIKILVACPRLYISDYQKNSDRCVQPFRCSYITRAIRSTKTTTFTLVLSKQPAPLSTVIPGQSLLFDVCHGTHPRLLQLCQLPCVEILKSYAKWNCSWDKNGIKKTLKRLSGC